MAKHARYFENPFINNPDVGANQVSRDFIRTQAQRLISRIIERNRTMDDYEGGAYVGCAGDGYAVHYASRLYPDKKEKYSSFCLNLSDTQLKHEEKRNNRAQFLLGSLGVRVIKAICEYEWKGVKDEEIKKTISSTIDTVCSKNYLPKGADEMLVGRAGFLAAVLNLRTRSGVEIISDVQVKRILDCILDSGRSYSRAHHCKAPLMYQYHGTEYLGAAHGLMGILQMLLSFSHLLDKSALQDIEITLGWLLEIQSENGNFVPDVEEIGCDRGSNELIHWCHGAPGAIHLMIVAYLCFKKKTFLEAAEKALDLIWEKGILRKGPGICHGVAGNGYAFLLYYRLTKKEKYLKYALCFACIMCDDHFKKQARTPDSPYSLFEGIGGSLCFLIDLIEPLEAQFPLVPINFEQ